MKARTATGIPIGALLVALLGACGEHRFEPPDREARVADADTAFNTVHFDTVAWESDSIRALQGNVVYSARCRQCHGSLGRGGTEYAAERNLPVPSLVDSSRELADSFEEVRHRIFVGHASGMPTWGVAGISPREIDAAAYYVVFQLRPEVLGGEGPGTGGSR
jgi:mono/diheme cytochrome c family protein